jgi:CBS-domain-containing membrane protein
MNLREYFSKMKGGAKGVPRVSLKEALWSGLGGAVGLGMCGWVSSYYLEPRALTLMLGSLGASAVLVYGVITSAFAQPRNLIGGHVISAFIGVVCQKLIGGNVWLAATMAVSLSIMAMLMTRTVHPPGGATAMTAVIGGKKVYDLGFFYVLVPVALGAFILLAVGLIVNNLSRKRKYPEFWF